MEVANQSFPKEQGEQEPNLVLCEGGRRCIGAKKKLMSNASCGSVGEGGLEPKTHD
jgi:hypothetical protein